MNAHAREPGLLQGMVLASLVWVAPAAAVVLGPVLPTMTAAFADTPGVDVKISLVATGPALLVALLAIPAGLLADRVGRRVLLLAALALYGVAGMAPLFLTSLDHIVLSRFVVGIAEAAILPAGTAVLTDYYIGRRRERWLAVQAGAAPLAAVVLVILGGALGAQGWRAPFYIYAWGFILIPLVLAFLWEPRRDQIAAANAAGGQDLGETLNVPKVLGISLAVIFSMIIFMVTVVQFSFLLTARGVAAPELIGLWSAFVTLANPLGAVLFALFPGRTSARLTVSYVLVASGLGIMATVPTPEMTIAGAFVANLGSGILLPTAITWLLSAFPAPKRGLGSGVWTSTNFFGQFLGPLVILVLVGMTGTLDNAVLAVSAACVLAAIASLAAFLRRPATKAVQSEK